MYLYSYEKHCLPADEDLIEQARRTAKEQHTTLNVAFREWLKGHVAKADSVTQYDECMRRLQRTVQATVPYSREEMNER